MDRTVFIYHSLLSDVPYLFMGRNISLNFSMKKNDIAQFFYNCKICQLNSRKIEEAIDKMRSEI